MRTRRKETEKTRGGLRFEPEALLATYRACLTNAEGLLEESRLLVEHQHYTRAFALAFTAWEEIGKSQLVVDHLEGVASAAEFREAFRDHRLNAAYLERAVRLSDTTSTATVEYDKNDISDMLQMRMKALYVDVNEDGTPRFPIDTVTRDTAETQIKEVERELASIAEAEWLNPKLGTKGLWK